MTLVFGIQNAIRDRDRSSLEKARLNGQLEEVEKKVILLAKLAYIRDSHLPLFFNSSIFYHKNAYFRLMKPHWRCLRKK